MIVSIVGLDRVGPDRIKVELFDDYAPPPADSKVRSLFVRDEVSKNFRLLVDAIRAAGFEKVTAGVLTEINEAELRASWESYREDIDRLTAAPSDSEP